MNVLIFAVAIVAIASGGIAAMAIRADVRRTRAEEKEAERAARRDVAELARTLGVDVDFVRRRATTEEYWMQTELVPEDTDHFRQLRTAFLVGYQGFDGRDQPPGDVGPVVAASGRPLGDIPVRFISAQPGVRDEVLAALELLGALDREYRQGAPPARDA